MSLKSETKREKRGERGERIEERREVKREAMRGEEEIGGRGSQEERRGERR